MPLLEIRGLQTWFETRAGTVKAVNGVDLSIERGETVALVGESGSGKSVTAYSVLRLIEAAGGRIAGGEVLFDGTDMLRLDPASLRAVRGNRIAMIFQEPLSALNPVQSIGTQIVEALRLHRDIGLRAARERAVELLELVRMPSPRERLEEYPHRLSGGMRQRAMIAIALACEPDLLIADEPTTALDVTTQAQILDLLRELQGRLGMAMLLITHDLGVVAETADRVAVLYAGRVVEQGPVETLFDAPAHPYTRGLLDAVRIEELRPGSRLPEIPGMVPSLLALPPGCAFAPRCPRATPACDAGPPAMRAGGEGRLHACFNPWPSTVKGRVPA
nr:ABC transporter ATP-binding protein [uncultured Roseococcus sp.]